MVGDVGGEVWSGSGGGGGRVRGGGFGEASFLALAIK